MKFLILLVSLFSFTGTTVDLAVEDYGKTKKISIKTSAVCGMCKVAIEKALYALEGVKKAELDLVTKKVKIKYDAALVDVATLRQAISATGYDADEVPARKKAYDALPGCCKKGSSCDMSTEDGQ